MSRTFNRDLALEVAAGREAGKVAVNKFGRANDGVDVTLSDIWDRADILLTQQIWIAPTAARIHDIVSTSASDTALGVGARTIRVSGLTSWSTAEVTEDITMNGITNVPTVNSYVIIHRIQVLTKGATSVNVGVITATAQVDLTVTAQINILEGQTQMAIYGIPSIQTAYMTRYYASMVDAGTNPANENAVDISLLINPEPDVESINFLVKHTQGVSNTGASSLPCSNFNPYFKIAGPAIIKMQAIAVNAETDLSAGFDLILETN